MVGSGSLREARPRSRGDIANLPDCPEIVAAARRRGITRVVHFTTVRGAVGVIATKAVKSRSQLNRDQYLEHVYTPNAPFRKDGRWLNYVNLSIERISDWMFGHSERWHARDDNPWVLLSFDIAILGHPGVVFTTTNNIYSSCRRAEGLGGFYCMFADPVEGRYGEIHSREDKDLAWPTDRQAEILYPGELRCGYLQCVEVQRAETIDTMKSVMAEFGMRVSVRHAPETFQ